MKDIKTSPSAILTSALAKKLFPTRSAVGQVLYMFNQSPIHVVWIVALCADTLASAKFWR